jgi:dihydrofolate reductase
MRKISLQMMTTLNGRLDTPFEWMGSVTNDHYEKIDELYSRYDTILVGRTTYEEMVSYWPGALTSGEGSAVNRRMAQRMHDCKKLVISRTDQHDISAWHNVEHVFAPTDEALTAFLTGLKRESGLMIHLSGGSELSRSIIRLGQVDEYNLFVAPAVSPGPSWFEGLTEASGLKLLDAESYQNGFVWLRYASDSWKLKEVPDTFTELLAN